MKIRKTIREKFSIGLFLAMFLSILPLIAAAQEKIAFASDRDGNFEIYVMNPDGTNQINLTNNSNGDYRPSFSPDGSKIAFDSFRDGSGEIYVMNADGTNPLRLTNNVVFDVDPSFGPDGSKIVFSSARDGNFEIYVMNADGSNQIRLTENAANDASPAFSLNGSKIAFGSIRDGNNEIYVMNSDGTGLTRLTFTHPFSDSSPSWGGQAIGNSPPTLSNVGSPNAGDSFTLTVNWGDGSPVEVFNYPAGTVSFVETHQYADDNPTATPSDNYTVNLTLSTPGGSAAGSVIVTVNNVAPVLSNLALNPSPPTGGSPANLSGTVTDAGLLDTHTVVIDWGDGSPTTTLNLAAGVMNFNAAHTYNTLGNFDITVTASDDDGGTTSETLNVNSVPPAPPAAPTNLRVDTVGANQVNLRWTDNANNESGFVIEQCRNQNCNNFVEIGQTGANVTTFSHTGLLNNTQYSYRVRAVNLGGDSAYSNTVKVKTLRK